MHGGRRSAQRTAQRPRGPARWGGLQGGLGVCIIVASAAVGTVATMVVRSTPGPLLGLFVVAGTVIAALAVRPRAGRMILPVPVLSYLVAALISGVVYSRSADTSSTALAISAAQWIANGFFAMVIATVLAVAITTARWYLWRRRRPATRDPGWPPPGAGAVRAGTGPAATGRPAQPRRPRAGWEDSAESGYPAGFARPGAPREAGQTGAPGGLRGSRRLGCRGFARQRPAPGAALGDRALQLLQRGVTEHQVLDAVVGTEVDFRLGLITVAVRGHHRAEAELVVGHHVPRRQRGHRPVTR